MPNWLRNVLAIIAGIVVGSVVNMAIITIGSAAVPPPAGVDVGNAESLAANIHLFGPQHFAVPFLAHALGTLAGALVAWLLGVRTKAVVAWVVGVFFLLGGIAASVMIPAPAWFIVLDLVVAYLPMAWLATVVGRKLRRPAAL